MAVQDTVPHIPASLDDVLVEQAMHPGFVGCPLETPLATVARLMATHRVHCVVGYGDLADGDTTLWGVVSDRDLVAAVAAGGGRHLTAGAAAATEVVTIAPGDTLARAVELMRDHDVSHLLVTDPDTDRPLGVLSTLDVAAIAAGVSPPSALPSASRVADLMTAPAVGVAPGTSLKDVAALLLERRISGVPVVDRGEVVGVVSEADILAKEQPETAGSNGRPRLGRRHELPSRGKHAARTAGEAMTSPAVTIAPWRSTAAAAALMANHGVKRLPVVHNGALVGVVTRTDLVRAFARGDGQIEREIREDVLRRAFWLAPDAVDVRVQDGRVTLTGDVESELEAEMVPRAVRRVPGVVSVEGELRPTRGGRRFSRVGGG